MRLICSLILPLSKSHLWKSLSSQRRCRILMVPRSLLVGRLIDTTQLPMVIREGAIKGN